MARPVERVLEATLEDLNREQMADGPIVRDIYTTDEAYQGRVSNKARRMSRVGSLRITLGLVGVAAIAGLVRLGSYTPGSPAAHPWINWPLIVVLAIVILSPLMGGVVRLAGWLRRSAMQAWDRFLFR